jgi:hypothetical protein
VLPSGKKLTFGLLATITLKEVLLCAYALFPEIHLRCCLYHLGCGQMATFQFYLEVGKQRKVGQVGDNSHVVSGQKSTCGKGSVRWCIIMMQEPVLLSGAESSHIIMQSL